MEAFTLSAILQLINGDHPIPLDSSCEEIVIYEDSSEDETTLDWSKEKESFYHKEMSVVLSKKNKDQIEYFYRCKPEKWSISIKEGSLARSKAEKAYSIAYKAAIKKYGKPEMDNKKYSFLYFSYLLMTLNDEYTDTDTLFPHAEWNIDGKHLGKLSVRESFLFPKSEKPEEKWAVEFSIDTNQQAICGTNLKKGKAIPCKNK